MTLEEVKKLAIFCPYCGAKPDFVVSEKPRVFLTIACMNNKCLVKPICGPHAPFEVTLSAWNRRYYPKAVIKMLSAYKRMDQFFGAVAKHKFPPIDSDFLRDEIKKLTEDIKKIDKKCDSQRF